MLAKHRKLHRCLLQLIKSEQLAWVTTSQGNNAAASLHCDVTSTAYQTESTVSSIEQECSCSYQGLGGRSAYRGSSPAHDHGKTHAMQLFASQSYSMISLRGISKTAANKVMPAKPAGEEDVALLASELFDNEERANLTPAAIVDALDSYIVGQADAKRAVAIALRNRWRRAQLPGSMANEVLPKNILMVGPTGCGKTEIARRLAKLVDAPFIKVEATKYTELGYVGRDVEDIIKDLVEAAQSVVRQRLQKHAAKGTAEMVENIILNALCGEHSTEGVRQSFRDLYRSGTLDDTQVELELPNPDSGPGKSFNLGDVGVIVMNREEFFRDVGGKTKSGKKQSVKVSEARSRLMDVEVDKLMSSEQVTREAIRAAEQDGIVFIDEIDKIVEGAGHRVGLAGGISGGGVQRDLLPIIEGSQVSTKYGNVNTDHILFICSGAFHQAKPQDMLAELQGRLPIRVSLRGLTAEDFYRILTVPKHNMLVQQQALLETEGVKLTFTDAAIRAIASTSEQVNRMLENIGARRLHTVLERILADVSFNAPELAEEAKRSGKALYEYVVDEDLVHRVLAPLTAKKDLSRYVL